MVEDDLRGEDRSIAYMYMIYQVDYVNDYFPDEGVTLKKIFERVESNETIGLKPVLLHGWFCLVRFASKRGKKTLRYEEGTRVTVTKFIVVHPFGLP